MNGRREGSPYIDVEESLRSLALDDRQVAVPRRVDQAVMAAWDAVGVDRPRRAAPWMRPWMWGSGVLGVAAGVMLAIFLPYGARAPRDQPLVSLAFRDSVASPVAVVEPPFAEPAAAAPLRLAVRRRLAPVEPPPEPYVLVPVQPGELVPLTLMRVRMTRNAFAQLGVPTVNPEAGGFVDVDLLIGEDGIARSIHRATVVE